MELLRMARIGALTALFAIPFVVLIVSSSMYFPFITGKNFAFRVLVEIAFASWVVLALSSPEYRPKKSVALWVGLAFVLWVGVATGFAENPVKAFWSNFERMEGYVTILHLAAYVVVLITVMRTEVMWRNLFFTTLGAATLVGLYSIFQLLGYATINQGGVRIDATLGNATYFAVYMLIHAFIALYAYVRWTGESRWFRIVLGTLVALFSILVFYSATRGSILGLVGGLGIAGIIVAFSRSVQPAVRYAGYGCLALIMVLLATFFAVKDTSYVQNHPILSRVASISLESGGVRFTIWSMALQGAMERPLVGWGQEGFNYVFNKYYRPELVTQEPWFDRAHNVVIDWLIAGGVPAMLLYLAFYVVLLYYLWRPGSAFDISERALLTGLLCAYGFHNLFVFDNLLSYILFALVFSYITVRAEGVHDGNGNAHLLPEVALPLASVGLCVLLYSSNWSGYSAATQIIQGLSPHQEGVTKNLEYFVKAASHHGLGHQEVGEQFLQFALQVRGLNVGDQIFQTSVIKAARTAFDSVREQAPRDARLSAFYGSFLRQVGDFPAARAQFELALAESPHKQSILIEQGILAMAEGQYATARSSFSEIYETAPHYNNVSTYLAATYILTGEKEKARELLRTRYGTDEPEDMTIADAYIRHNEYEKGLRIAIAIAEHQQNFESLRYLASVYLAGHDVQNAILTLEKVKRVDPSLTQTIDAYIASIRQGAQ